MYISYMTFPGRVFYTFLREMEGVLTSSLSGNMHDFSCWCNKNTSDFFNGLYSFILKNQVTSIIILEQTSVLHWYREWFLNTSIMVTYRDVWRQWHTTPLRCSVYTLHYRVLNLMENKYKWFLSRLEGLLLCLRQQPSKTKVNLYTINETLLCRNLSVELHSFWFLNNLK